MLAKIVGEPRADEADRLPIASIHAGESAVTYSVPSAASRTVVALATAGPTASRQANATFSSVSGALRMTSATTPGMT